MARGRMINNRICADVAINNLSCDTSRLAFTWLITFADSEGRTYGDPAMVRSLLFPRRYDVSVEAMASYIAEWAEQGLIVWYEAEGDRWIWFPSFEKNQRGLDRRKEGKSTIPAPVPDTVNEQPQSVPSTCQERTEYAPSTAEQNRTEENRTEGESVPSTAAIVQRCAAMWFAGSGKEPTNGDRERLCHALDEYGDDRVIYAFEQGIKYNAMAWPYIFKVLKNADTVPKKGAPPKPLPDVVETFDWTRGEWHETRLSHGSESDRPTTA